MPFPFLWETDSYKIFDSEINFIEKANDIIKHANIKLVIVLHDIKKTKYIANIVLPNIALFFLPILSTITVLGILSNILNAGNNASINITCAELKFFTSTKKINDIA